MEEEKKPEENAGIYHRNGQCEDMKDIPKQQIERHDGLPTVDNLAKLMGKNGEEEAEPTEGDKLSKFIEVIIKIK